MVLCSFALNKRRKQWCVWWFGDNNNATMRELSKFITSLWAFHKVSSQVWMYTYRVKWTPVWMYTYRVKRTQVWMYTYRVKRTQVWMYTYRVKWTQGELSDRVTDSWSKGLGFESRQESGILFCCCCWLLFRYPFHPRVTAAVPCGGGTGVRQKWTGYGCEGKVQCGEDTSVRESAE